MLTASTRLYLLLFVLACSVFSLQAQILEEISNPFNYSLNWFSGGDETLFFDYNDDNFNSTLFEYDDMNLSFIPIPPENVSFMYYSHSFADKAYIVVFDINFNGSLFEYNGTTAVPIPLPAGLEFGYYVTNYEDLMMVVLYDEQFNSIFYQYDGTTMQEVSAPAADMTYANFIINYGGSLWLTFSDPGTFNANLFAYNGASFTPIPGLPDEVSLMYLAWESDEAFFVGAADQNFMVDLYKFDGAAFSLIPSPDGLSFSNVYGENETVGEIYFNFFDNSNFTSSLYIYDGENLASVNIPTGFDFPNLVSIFNGITYISLLDINFNGTLFQLEGTSLNEVSAGTGDTYGFHLDSLLGSDYHIFYDQNFNYSLYKLDQTGTTVSEVTGPTGGWTLGNFATVDNHKMFLSYFDNNFNYSLFMFDGTAFTKIENPAALNYNFFMTKKDGSIYLRYDHQNTFEGTLFKLILNSLPTSLDNTVTTYTNIPYFFQSSDFFFADPDLGDSLSFILITEVEQVGYLLWDGAHVYKDDIIPVSEIKNMTFTPLTDEVGSPYDAFRFRVGDGEAFSEENYLMQINVEDPATSVTNNELNIFTTLAPMPANLFTNINLTTNQSIDALSIDIFSSAGQLMDQRQYEGLGNSFRETIDVTSYSTGTYYILGRTSQGRFLKPLLIQR